MTLDKYLTRKETTSKQFAKTIDESLSSVHKWRQRIRIPRAHIIAKIERTTKGHVTLKDWC